MCAKKRPCSKKLSFNTHENLGWGRIDLPEIEMHTAAAWIDFDDEQLCARVGRERAGDVLYGLSYILRHIAPVFAFCDTGDIHAQHQSRSSHSGAPSIYIYDAIPGGVGIAPRIYALLPDIASGALHALAACGCEGGCPGCSGPMPGNDTHIKQSVADILAELAGYAGSVH
jgi:DEAD/DEAH box helicase domain-containing protein